MQHLSTGHRAENSARSIGANGRTVFLSFVLKRACATLIAASRGVWQAAISVAHADINAKVVKSSPPQSEYGLTNYV